MSIFKSLSLIGNFSNPSNKSSSSVLSVNNNGVSLGNNNLSLNETTGRWCPTIIWVGQNKNLVAA